MMRYQFHVFFALLGMALAHPGRGQTPTADTTDTGWGSAAGWDVPKAAEARPAGKPKLPRRVPYRVLRRGEKQQEQSYVREHHLRHAFDHFYRSPAGDWYVLHRRWGIREFDPHPFQLVPGPALDRATFQNHFPYWQDRGGVYFAALMYYQPQIDTVTQADLPTFRGLGFENLAVDQRHVYHEGRILPGLAPTTLRVFTPEGQRYNHPIGNCDAYLLSDSVGYKLPLCTRLTSAEVWQFEPPATYQLVYSAADSLARPRR